MTSRSHSLRAAATNTFLLAAFTLFALNAASAQKRPMTFTDLMAMHRISDPQPSPDGRWPALSAKEFKTPTLVIHGQLDYRLDVSQGLQLFTTLQRQNVPSEMLYFPDEGHWVLKPQNSQLWYKTVSAWCDRWTHTNGAGN